MFLFWDLQKKLFHNFGHRPLGEGDAAVCLCVRRGDKAPMGLADGVRWQAVLANSSRWSVNTNMDLFGWREGTAVVFLPLLLLKY